MPHLSHDISAPVQQTSPHLSRLVPSCVADIGAKDKQQRQSHAGVGDERIAGRVCGKRGESTGQRTLVQSIHVRDQEHAGAADPEERGGDVLHDVGLGDGQQAVDQTAGLPVLLPLREVIYLCGKRGRQGVDS